MLKKTIIFTIIFLIAIQFIGVDKTVPEFDKKLSLVAPVEVESILKSSCYDCHSFETKWPSYSNFAPVSFFVASHVKNGRKAMNFSLWNAIDPKIKEARLKRAIVTVNNEMMALPSYVSAHEEAKLSKQDKEVLTKWFKEEIKSLKEI